MTDPESLIQICEELLGFRADSWPPSPHRLLGIPPEERDPKAIRAARLAQTKNVRRWAHTATGERARHIQDLLNAINRAAVDQADAVETGHASLARGTASVEVLRNRVESREFAPPLTSRPVGAGPEPSPAETSKPVPDKSSPPQGQRVHWPWFAWAAAVIALIGLGSAVLLNRPEQPLTGPGTVSADKTAVSRDTPKPTSTPGEPSAPSAESNHASEGGQEQPLAIPQEVAKLLDDVRSLAKLSDYYANAPNDILLRSDNWAITASVKAVQRANAEQTALTALVRLAEKHMHGTNNADFGTCWSTAIALRSFVHHRGRWLPLIRRLANHPSSLVSGMAHEILREVRTAEILRERETAQLSAMDGREESARAGRESPKMIHAWQKDIFAFYREIAETIKATKVKPESREHGEMALVRMVFRDSFAGSRVAWPLKGIAWRIHQFSSGSGGSLMFEENISSEGEVMRVQFSITLSSALLREWQKVKAGSDVTCFAEIRIVGAVGQRFHTDNAIGWRVSVFGYAGPPTQTTRDAP